MATLVTTLSSGIQCSSLVIEGLNILELEIERDAISSASAATPVIDPAIVSYYRPSTKPEIASPNTSPDRHRPSPPTSESPDVSALASRTVLLRPLSKPIVPIDTKSQETTLQSPIFGDNVASATLTAPFNELSLDGDPRGQEYAEESTTFPQDDVSHEPEQLLPTQPTVKSKSRRIRTRRRTARARAGDLGDVSTGPQTIQLEPTPSVANAGGRRPNGWRQTPLTEPASHATLRQTPDPHSSPKQDLTEKRVRRQRLKTSEDQNGWITGEATDIQDMGDFDFEGNLSKFDKRGVFDKIRLEDTTADEDRLVSFNRLPARPGSAGGKNLHHTENVLDSPTAHGRIVWNSEDSEKDMSEAKASSGRSSRRNISRVSVRNSSSRKGSAILGNDHNTGSRLLSDPVARARYSSHEQAASPKLPNHSTLRFSKPGARSGASLRITPSDHICPCVSPLQMAELEQLAISELGLSEDVIAENASRGIAEAAIKVVMKKREEAPSQLISGSPLIIILSGNNKSGARAIAAARHLRNHNSKVVVCMLGLEREGDLLESVRRQLNTYRKCGGLITTAEGLDKSLRALKAPTELIVDALLGMHLSFEDLGTDDQAAYIQLTNWANNNEASVLAVEVPSGLDASSGISIIAYITVQR